MKDGWKCNWDGCDVGTVYHTATEVVQHAQTHLNLEGKTFDCRFGGCRKKVIRRKVELHVKTHFRRILWPSPHRCVLCGIPLSHHDVPIHMRLHERKQNAHIPNQDSTDSARILTCEWSGCTVTQPFESSDALAWHLHDAHGLKNKKGLCEWHGCGKQKKQLAMHVNGVHLHRRRRDRLTRKSVRPHDALPPPQPVEESFEESIRRTAGRRSKSRGLAKMLQNAQRKECAWTIEQLCEGVKTHVWKPEQVRQVVMYKQWYLQYVEKRPEYLEDEAFKNSLPTSCEENAEPKRKLYGFPLTQEVMQGFIRNLRDPELCAYSHGTAKCVSTVTTWDHLYCRGGRGDTFKQDNAWALQAQAPAQARPPRAPAPAQQAHAPAVAPAQPTPAPQVDDVTNFCGECGRAATGTKFCKSCGKKI
eukprot:TRINITY_DN328_c0_g1_i13.p1 TRINITY_DN328_c0_g1~~TRINITY_DN328_c0_g1_i13.p1  ORF type:complete len:417 (+),score=48.58 TRINITY_DN328_c0_g1_i13:744-1994(+)